MPGLLETVPKSREVLEILTRIPARRPPGENREYVRALFPLLAEARRKGHGFVKIAEILGRHGIVISRSTLERHYRALETENAAGAEEDVTDPYGLIPSVSYKLTNKDNGKQRIGCFEGIQDGKYVFVLLGNCGTVEKHLSPEAMQHYEVSQL